MPRKFMVGIFVFALAANGVRADGPDAKSLRLKEMTIRAGLLKMAFPGDPTRPAPVIGKKPVLRCDDPTREEVDGTIWLWTDRKLPVAILGLCDVRNEWSYENLSLTDEAIEVSGRPNWKWRPTPTKRTWITLPDKVPDTTEGRQRTLREIARQFQASESYDRQTFQLRLLTRPIYTYSDSETGVLDGALFALANGTNPEVLIQIEARRSETQPQWLVTFGRLTAAEATIVHQKKEVWKVGNIGPWSQLADYYSYHGPDPLD